MDRVIRLLTIEEAARELGISSSEAWRLVSEGRLTASRIDGRCIVSEMQLQFFKHSHPAAVVGG